jgi:hypothetical protein
VLATLKIIVLVQREMENRRSPLVVGSAPFGGGDCESIGVYRPMTGPEVLASRSGVAEFLGMGPSLPKNLKL